MFAGWELYAVALAQYIITANTGSILSRWTIIDYLDDLHELDYLDDLDELDFPDDLDEIDYLDDLDRGLSYVRNFGMI